MYTDKDNEMLKEKICEIEDEVEYIKGKTLHPTREKFQEYIDVVLEFVKNKGRKIYGGTAQDALIRNIEPKDAFYTESHEPDIDFYSPDPIGDIIELTNILFEKGFSDVQGTEARHSETYTIFVDKKNVADISYVPRNIYHRLPFSKINGYNYIGQVVVMIDMYEMFTEPYFSSHRWKKTFPRVMAFQKHFPFIKPNSALKVNDKDTKETIDMKNVVYQYIKQNNDFICVGDYAYNVLLNESGILNDKKYSKIYKLINYPSLECTIVDYKKNGQELLKHLQDSFPNLKDKIKVLETYPFWDKQGYSFTILYDNVQIFRGQDYRCRCVPFQVVDSMDFYTGEPKKDGDKITIGSFGYIMVNNFVYGLRCHVNKKSECTHYHNKISSMLVEMRNYYLEKNKKTLFDESMFKEFQVQCKGETMDALRKNLLEMSIKRRQKKMTKFMYHPPNKINNTYKFKNSSGNPINNEKNFKLIITGSKTLKRCSEKEYQKFIKELEESKEIENNDDNSD